jgi:hypothetical protein
MAPVNIYCDLHPDFEVEYYCKKHIKMMCNKCALITHSDHLEHLVQVERFGVENFCERVRIKLNLLKNKILEVCDVLNSYKVCEKAFGSDEFLHLVNDAQGILLPHLRTQQEKNDIEFLRDGLHIATLIPKTEPQQPVVSQPPPNQDIQPPAAKQKSKIELLLDWLVEVEQNALNAG